MVFGIKSSLSKVVPNALWCLLREMRILHNHARVASFCQTLVEEYLASPMSKESLPIRPLKSLYDNRVIWQYWAQGFDGAPVVVKECLKSVDKWRGDYLVIRLDDNNLSEYIELPDYILESRRYMSRAYFSDLLRTCLLTVYGGLWLDATVLLSGPIPEYLFKGDFFLYQRDSGEKDKRYWENVYAYYFGWSKGFRVNVLSSVFYSVKDGDLVNILSGVMLYYWRLGAKDIPDYFFLQILFDVLVKGSFGIKNCMVVSDCQPHYLQQSINDPKFSLASREEILQTIPIHKLSYK